MKTRPLTQTELNEMKCGCGKPGIHFIPRCHSDIGALRLEYKPEGILIVTCRVCDQFVCEIQVAEK